MNPFLTFEIAGFLSRQEPVLPSIPTKIQETSAVVPTPFLIPVLTVHTCSDAMVHYLLVVLFHPKKISSV